MIRYIAAALTAGAALAWAGPARAAECAGLADLKIEATNLLSATEVPAANGLPAYCRVLGYVRPAINFEIRLPAEGWNGKFYMAGCGGFCGTLDADRSSSSNSINHGLRRGYAVSTMDGGHWGANVTGARWALADPVAEMDWGQRAVTETARVTKAVIAARYGRAQERSYFAGCSTGGRMAAMEASRYPTDFDGVIVGAPALDYTGLVGTAFAHVTQANTGPDGKPIFPHTKVGLVADAVSKACGDATGLVADPRRCSFQPASLRCTGNQDETCLTPAEVGVLERWYTGPKDSRGAQLYPGGIPVGSEHNWPLWLTGNGRAAPVLPNFAQNFLRYMAFEPDAGARYTVGQFDFDRDPARMADAATAYNAATFDPKTQTMVPAADLSAFAGRGGKMILWHGLGDPLVTPQPTVEYYDALARAAGGAEAVRGFARLFLVPGMDHCGINAAGPAIADGGIDPLTALEEWVERGRAPDRLTATKAGADGKPAWSRPVCAHPQTARATGGDPAAASGYECAGP